MLLDVSVVTGESSSAAWVSEQCDSVVVKLVSRTNNLVELLEVLGPLGGPQVRRVHRLQGNLYYKGPLLWSFIKS